MNIYDRIKMLDRKIDYIAWKLSSPGMPKEDVYQEILIGLIEKNDLYKLADQTDAYIVKLAEWIGRNRLDASLTYNKYVDEERIFTGDDGDEISTFELIPSEIQDLENSLVIHEALAGVVTRATGADIRVIRLLYLGYSKSQIANELGVSKAAISQHIKKIKGWVVGLNHGEPASETAWR